MNTSSGDFPFLSDADKNVVKSAAKATAEMFGIPHSSAVKVVRDGQTDLIENFDERAAGHLTDVLTSYDAGGPVTPAAIAAVFTHRSPVRDANVYDDHVSIHWHGDGLYASTGEESLMPDGAAFRHGVESSEGWLSFSTSIPPDTIDVMTVLDALIGREAEKGIRNAMLQGLRSGRDLEAAAIATYLVRFGGIDSSRTDPVREWVATGVMNNEAKKVRYGLVSGKPGDALLGDDVPYHHIFAITRGRADDATKLLTMAVEETG